MPGPRTKRTRVIALVVATSVVAFLTIFSLWINRQALNTGHWADSSSKLIDNKDVRTQIAAFLVDEVYANVNVQARIREALPPRAKPLAPAAAGGLRNLAEEAVFELLGRPRVQHAWEEANRRAHKRFLTVLNGGGNTVSTQGGVVTLDLKALLKHAEARVGVGGKLAKKLPADAARITIMRSDQLDFAQDVVRFLRHLPVLLIGLMLTGYALAIGIARSWRREALRDCGIGLVAAGLVALAARSFAGQAVVNSLTSTDSAKDAVQAVWGIETSWLVSTATAAIAYGVIALAGAWLAGPGKRATAIRKALAPHAHEGRVVYGAVGAVVLLILIWGPTPATRNPIMALILIALLGLGVETLRRQIVREHPSP